MLVVLDSDDGHEHHCQNVATDTVIYCHHNYLYVTAIVNDDLSLDGNLWRQLLSDVCVVAVLIMASSCLEMIVGRDIYQCRGHHDASHCHKYHVFAAGYGDCGGTSFDCVDRGDYSLLICDDDAFVGQTCTLFSTCSDVRLPSSTNELRRLAICLGAAFIWFITDVAVAMSPSTDALPFLFHPRLLLLLLLFHLLPDELL